MHELYDYSTCRKAANLLYKKFSSHSWFTSIGITKGSRPLKIIIYTKSVEDTKKEFLESTFHGYDVQIKKMGTPQILLYGEY